MGISIVILIAVLLNISGAIIAKYVTVNTAVLNIVPKKFEEIGVVLEYKDYSGRPKCDRLCLPFDHYVTVLVVIFNCGPKASYHIGSWREQG